MSKRERKRPAPLPPALREQFAAIVGAEYAISDARDMAPYLSEWRGLFDGKAAMVLRPNNAAEVAQILTLANDTNTPIVPQSGNTGLVGGQVPFETGEEIVLSLQRMNEIRDVDRRSGTMIAEAGVILADAQAAAEAAGFLLPLSLASEGSCQIGGNLATNAGGTAVLAYGNTRDLTLGLEVVLADGRIWSGLRALKKDNTGYDLKNLFIGSEGTLGVITAAVLQLAPLPAERACAFVGLASLAHVAGLYESARALIGRQLTTFEVMPRIGLEFALKHGAGTRDPLAAAHDWYVLIEISGSRADGSTQALLEALLEQALDEDVVADAAAAASLAQAKDFWRLRALLSEVQKHEGGSIKHDVSVPIARVPELIETASARVEELVPGCRSVPFGHFGDGNIHFNVSQPIGADRAAFMARWDEMNDAVHEIVLSLGGSVGAEHGIGRLKRDLLARVKADVELDLMRSLKRALDPNGILNPGKVL